jgi:hypothetical protein
MMTTVFGICLIYIGYNLIFKILGVVISADLVFDFGYLIFDYFIEVLGNKKN